VHHLSLGHTLTLLLEGTGKSFVGALCAKILLQSRPPAIGRSPFASVFTTSTFAASPNTKILVTCYSNHALDQFLEDLINIGIPKNEIVRIGGKPNQKTAELSLQLLSRTSGDRMSWYHWEKVEMLREQRGHFIKSLHRAYSAAIVGHHNIMQYIAVRHPEYAAAFRVPKSRDGTTFVGKGGKAIRPNYLLDRWLKGQDASPFENEYHIQVFEGIWKMEHAARLSRSETWKREVVKKEIEDMLRIGEKYNQCVTALESNYRMGEASVLRNRKIIACTTTGAAMYRSGRFISHWSLIILTLG
jgi:hypothetical protein